MSDDEKKLTPGQYNKVIYDWMNGVPADEPKKIKPEPEFCYHNWVNYKGLLREDEYCTKCELKRDLPKPIESNDPWSHDDDGSF